MKKGEHIQNCPVPGTWFRRLGSIWACECGQLWRLAVGTGYGEPNRVWERLNP